MFGTLNPSVWLLGLVALVAGLLLVRSLFSAEARIQRRRRKNYGRTVSKHKGPTIKLAVRTKDWRRRI
jgi:hypothetical protein